MTERSRVAILTGFYDTCTAMITPHWLLWLRWLHWTRRRLSHQQDGLDPTICLSLSGLSFDCALKQRTDQGEPPIQLLQGVNMYTFFEKGIRGEICHAARQYRHGQK